MFNLRTVLRLGEKRDLCSKIARKYTGKVFDAIDEDSAIPPEAKQALRQGAKMVSWRWDGTRVANYHNANEKYEHLAESLLLPLIPYSRLQKILDNIK